MRLGFIFILFFLLHVCMFFRKYTLLLNNVFVGVAVVLQCFAVNPAMFILGRFVVGINAGKVWASMQVRCGIPPVGVGVVAAVHHTMLYFGRSSSFAFSQNRKRRQNYDIRRIIKCCVFVLFSMKVIFSE